MIINRLKLTNWKNFQNVDVRLSDRNFIVGANASGKSNFLDVIRFLRDIVKQAGGLQYAIGERDGVSKIRCLAARSKSQIEIEIELSESVKSNEPSWRYILKFTHQSDKKNQNQARIIEESAFNKAGKRVLHRKDSDKKEDPETLRFTWLEQPQANKEIRELYHFFQAIQYLHIVPQLIRDAGSYTLASNKEDFFGRNLLETMSGKTTKTRESYFRKINEVLQIAVPQLKNISFVKDSKNGTPHLEAVYDHWRPQGAKQRETQFSDGTLRLIGFMWAILDGQETILLEEPELYLHAEIVKQLPEFIHKLQKKKGKNRQVIISTHSHELLSNSGIGSDEVIELQITSEGTSARTVSDNPEAVRELNAGLNMAEVIIPRVAPQGIQGLLDLNFDDK